MHLAPGTRIGPYEVVSMVGAGGMGEVYRARDARLGRDVALKILPTAFASDPERIARFDREARTLATLNHPHIGAIYGVEETNGLRALALEFVDGETLADRIAHGPIPLDETLPIARQIADALEAAHEHGIVHRDLKPANIKVGEDGTVKVLDFGLAKAVEPAIAANETGTLSPTITSPAMTQAGIILGTAAYMSPEQAKGRAADKRSDIWAFGCVLYEMLTARRAFEGEDVSETLAAVLRSQPDLTKVPEQVRGLLAACLERDPRQRLRDIGDAPRLITQQAPTSRRGRLIWTVTFGVGVALVIFVLASFRFARASPDRPLIRLDVDLGGDTVATGTNNVVISPDGTRIVFLARDRASADSRQTIATRRLDATGATSLPGTEGARLLFFSPDSQWVGFFADRKLKKIALAGGTPVALCDAPTPSGASWGDDGYIVAAVDWNRGLVRLPDSGGTPRQLTEIEAGEVHTLPQVLPGARGVIFTVGASRFGSWADSTVQVVTVRTGERKSLVNRGFFGHYVPSMGTTGHLLYVSENVLAAVPFDPSRLEVQGQPVTLAEQVGAPDFRSAGSFSASSTGTFVYRPDTATADTYEVLWLDRSGKTAPLLSKPAAYYNPYLSPDGRRLAVTVVSERGREIWVYEQGREIMTRVTTDANTGQSTVWTPDGQHLLYWRPSANGYAIISVRADGAGAPFVLLESKNVIVPTSFSETQRRLLYFEIDPQTHQDLWTLPVEFSQGEDPKPGKPEPFLRTRIPEYEPAFSPDGHWVAYRAGEGMNTPIFVRRYPGAGAQWQISSGVGPDRNPMWSPDARQLYYESGDNRIMVVDYSIRGDSFEASKARVWSEYRTRGIVAAYDLTLAPDGKRFVVLGPTQTTGANAVPATVWLNFYDELRRRVPPR